MNVIARAAAAVRSATNEVVGRLMQLIALLVVLSPIWIVGWVIVDNRAETLERERQQEQYVEEQRLWDWGYRTCLEELVRRRTGDPYICEEYADQVDGAVNHQDR